MEDRKNFLYRGITNHRSLFDKLTVNTNRVPMGSSWELHNLFDNEFYKKFGWKARSNSIFCTGLEDIAMTYGMGYIVFPIGNFKYLWSMEAKDLYIYCLQNFIIDHKHLEGQAFTTVAKKFNGSKVIQSETEIELERLVKEKQKKIDKVMKSYKTTGLNEAIDSGSEIMINCKEYYALHHSVLIEQEEELIQLLKS